MKRLFLLTALLAAGLAAAAQECRPIAIAAHRGHWTAPEAGRAQNSVAALRAAQRIGCWGSELDIHLSGDHIVVVNHDDTRAGLPVQKSAYSELRGLLLVNGEPLPTLCEYLAQGLATDKTVLVIELKEQYSEEWEIRLIDKTIESLKLYGLFDPERVMFISFSHHICRRLAEAAPGFTNQYLRGDLSPEVLHREGINGIDYHFSAFDRHPEWVEEAHRLGMSVNVWTVDKEEDIRRMIGLGVDCITTNDPLLVRQLLGTREKRL